MQHDLDALHRQYWVHTRTDRWHIFRERTAPHKGDDHAPAVTIKLGRLHQNHKWNGLAQRPLVAVDIKLSHYRLECSSASEPSTVSTVFQPSAQALGARPCSRHARCSCWTNSHSRRSVVADRLSVYLRASATTPSLMVRSTGFLRFGISGSDTVSRSLIAYTLIAFSYARAGPARTNLGRPPFLPFSRAACALTALLLPPLRAAINVAAMSISGSLADTRPAIDTCRSRTSRNNAPPPTPSSKPSNAPSVRAATCG